MAAKRPLANYSGTIKELSTGDGLEGTWQGTAIASGYGGTGFTTYATGDIIYASGVNTLAKLAAGTDGQVLTLAGGVPTWAAASTGTVTSVNLTAGTGISVSGGPITTSGSITVTNTDTGSAQNIFKTISVSGQSDVVADSNNATLTLEAGSNITITTDAGANSITIAASGGSGGSVPTGVILDYGGSSPPAGFLECDGSNVSRATYSDLFAVIGTTFGVGDGSTTFGLPDFRRRVAVGAGGTGTSELGNTVGSTGGSETHTLSQAEMPSHTHLQDAHQHSGTFQSHIGVSSGSGGLLLLGGTQRLPTSASWANVAGSHRTPVATATNQNTGGGGAHNNMQPSLVVTKIIKY